MESDILKKLDKHDKIQYIYECLTLETKYRIGINLVWLMALLFVVIGITLFMLQLYGAVISMILVGLAVCLITALINKTFTNMVKDKIDNKYGGR